MKRTIGILAGLAALCALLFWYGDLMREEMRVCFDIGKRIMASPPAFNSEYPPFISAVFALMAMGGRHAFTWAWASVLFFSVSGIALYGWYVLRDPLSAFFPLLTALTVLALGPTLVLGRFDILLFFATFVAWRAFEKDRMAVSGFFAIVAVAIKLVPLLFLPLLFLLAPHHKRYRFLTGCAAGVATCTVFAVTVLGPAGFIQNIAYMLSYHAARGLQVESTWAGLFMAGSELVGGRADIAYTYGAYHLSSIPAWVPRLIAPVTLAGVALLTWLGWRNRRSPEALPAYLCIVILWGFTASNVLSPQYFAWILPLVAVFLMHRCRPRSPAWLCATVSVLLITGITHWLYPSSYERLLGLMPDALVLLNVRNLLLPVLAVSLARMVRVVPHHNAA